MYFCLALPCLTFAGTNKALAVFKGLDFGWVKGGGKKEVKEAQVRSGQEKCNGAWIGGGDADRDGRTDGRTDLSFLLLLFWTLVLRHEIEIG
jgi:hypothetical protein